MRRIWPLLLIGVAPPLAAQEVIDCDWQSQARSIIEPWEDNSRTFANGAVRLAALDTVEPAAGSAYLLILSPPYSELGERQCKVVGFSGGMGYAAIDFAALEAGYDPAVGLVFTLPARIYLPETGFTNSVFLSIVVNQSTGAVAVSGELGGE